MSTYEMSVLQCTSYSSKFDYSENYTNKTTSSAFTERPHDALCLPVVSFNSTVSRPQSFIITYCGFRFMCTTADNYMLFCCLCIMLRILLVDTSLSSPVNNKRRRLPATSITNLPRSGTDMCIALGCQTSATHDEVRYWSRISIFSLLTCIRCPCSAPMIQYH